MFKNLLSVIFIVIFIIPAVSQRKNILPLIPEPASLIQKKGHFNINSSTEIIVEDEKLLQDVSLFNEYFEQNFGFELKILRADSQNNNSIKIIKKSFPGHNEGYTLKITKHSIIITGDDKGGVFYALQTLKQLLPLRKSGKLKIPCLEISDYPTFTWRGMHLDVCRHFFGKEFIKKYIDYIALYKMNTFHWHLTDDQGWRIEIKKYPELTKTGAWRKGTIISHSTGIEDKYDTAIYGGFYSQGDIREIVEYANKRHVTIIPEIEMPGHSLAALASYPVFSCTGGPFSVANNWGVIEDVYCPKDTTFKFLEDVLTEVMSLFPGKYIHIGGDEVSKTRWKNCPDCQELIREKGLKDENELQSYFIRHIDSFITVHGRNLIGWDEILEGGLAPNAAVMSWRGTEGGLAAAKLHHNVVMTPGQYCYFDHYQGDSRYEPLAIGGYTTVEKVYSYNPVPAELDSSYAKFILGAQGNVWTEYIPNEKHVEYMVFPRICALSEVLWTQVHEKDYNNFKARLIKHFSYLDKMNINYARSIFEIQGSVMPDSSGKAALFLSLNQNYKTKILYTDDNTEPVKKSYRYRSPFSISKSCTIKAKGFDSDGTAKGRFEQTFHITKSTGKKITLLTQPEKRYSTGGALTLVDGILGHIPWNGKEWLGFSGNDLNAVIDLGKDTSVSKISVDVLRAEASWIYLPKRIMIFISENGKDFFNIAKADSFEIKSKGRSIDFKFDNINTRFIKVIVENQGKIPSGKPGEGNDAWLFVDEIMVE